MASNFGKCHSAWVAIAVAIDHVKTGCASALHSGTPCASLFVDATGSIPSKAVSPLLKARAGVDKRGIVDRPTIPLGKAEKPVVMKGRICMGAYRRSYKEENL